MDARDVARRVAELVFEWGRAAVSKDWVTTCFTSNQGIFIRRIVRSAYRSTDLLGLIKCRVSSRENESLESQSNG